MMGGGWLCLLAAVYLVGVQGEDVGVSMCCPAGRILKIVKNNGKKLGGWRKERGEDYIPKCVRSRRGPKDTLDGSSIVVVQDDMAGLDGMTGAGEKPMVAKNTGVMMPSCSLGRKFQMVNLKASVSDDEGSGSGDEEYVDTSSRVRLGDYRCGRSKCHKGNVYVDDKPVCDDGWDDTDANVVCKELGFRSGGYSTKESYFGKVDLERQSGFDEVRCSGRESSLVDCRHESFDDCGDSEGAGVVCYRDEEDYYDGDYEEEQTSGGSSSSSVHLTSAGNLVLPDNSTYKAGEFCMAGVFQGEDEWNKEAQEGEAVAVMCEPCKSEVLCSVLLLDVMDSFPGKEIEGDDREFGSNNVVLVGDKNADGKVNFEEFKAGVDGYVEKLFNVLDKDGDGSLDKDKEVSIKSLSAKFFLQLLDEGFLFFDVNQDDVMSVQDAPTRTFYDRNEDGKISLREVFGVSLINLPAPLYRLYATLDKDKNEKISIDEATNFLKSTLSMVDKNEDCSVNIDEIITSLDESHLPKQYQLAVKLMGDYYLEMGDFILKEFATAADVDGNNKVTLAEIIGLKDPAVLFDIQTIIMKMGFPNRRIAEFIGGCCSWEREMEVREMWLNVLYDFVDNRKFQSAPTDYCDS